MPLFAGIDGGQSSTTAVVGDEHGRILGFGQGGPCNHVEGPEGRPKFINAIEGCLRQACQEAALRFETVQFISVCGGFSGGPEDKQSLLAEVVRSEHYFVTTDAAIALAGAIGGEPGVIVIAGTGSIAYGRNHARKSARAGGWGYVFGDEGGGFDLTRQALRAILREEEGWGPATSLREKLLAATAASSANDLLHRFYTTAYDRPAIAALSRLVDQAAAQGDVVAHGIVTNTAQQLAALVSAVRTQLFEPQSPVKVAYIGGVFGSAILFTRFQMLVELEEGNSVIAPLFGPATGALLEAYAAVGQQPTLTDVPPAEKPQAQNH